MSVADLVPLLQELRDWLNEAKGPNGVNGSQGQLSDPRKSYVRTRLDSVQAGIAQIRDPHDPAALSPPDIGNVITTYDPTTTAAYASDCYTLALEAYNNANGPLFTNQY